MAYIKLKDISKIYANENNSVVGIRKINLSFEKGEFVAITGKSGSGKTTLLNVIGGLDEFDEGELYFEGNPTSHFTKSEWESYSSKNISFIFQNYNILESFTVLENIEFALTTIKDTKIRKERAKEIAKKVGLFERLNIKGSKLSGGEKQRTVIARAIAKDSPIILADEPTGNLDSKNAQSILRLLKEISEDKLVIVVTHNYEDIREYATRHIRIFDGQICNDNTFIEVDASDYKEPKDDYRCEREFVFKNRIPKIKCEKGQKKYDVRDSVLLGIKRFLSRPRQNFVIILILFVALTGILLTISSVDGFNAPAINLNGANINPIEGRVLIGGGDEGFSHEKAQMLADKYGAKKYLINDYILDQRVSMVREDSVNNIGYGISGYLKLCDNQRLKKGRLPQSPDEIALKIPYTYANEYKIGDKIMFFNRAFGCTIVGVDYYVGGRNQIEFYVQEKTFEIYSQYTKYFEQISYVIWDNEETGDNEGILYPVNPDVADYNYVSIYIDFSYEGKVIKTNNIKADGTIGVEIYDNQNNMLLRLYPEHAQKLDYPYYYSDKETILIFSQEAFEEIYFSQSGQISLFFEDDDSAQIAISKMTEDGYLALLSTKLGEHKNIIIKDLIAKFLISSAVSIAVTLLLSLVVIFTLIKILSISKKDVVIFRTMAIKNNVVRLSTYIQLIMDFIIALLLSAIVIVVLYFAPTGWAINFLGVRAVAILLLCVLVLLLILAYTYNKTIFKEKIKKGLRRVNK